MAWPAFHQLKSRQFFGLAKSVQEFLNPVLDGRNKDTISKEYANDLCVFVARFLAESVSLLSENNAIESGGSELLNAIDFCCCGYLQIRDLAALNMDPLTVPKIVHHIINKLTPQAGINIFLKMGHHLLHILKLFNDIGDNVLGVIACNSFSFLWNAAITFEGQKQGTELQLFQMRLLSLRILARRQSKHEVALEKAKTVLNVFEQHIKQGMTCKEMSDNVQSHKATPITKSRTETSDCGQTFKDKNGKSVNSSIRKKTGSKDLKTRRCNKDVEAENGFDDQRKALIETSVLDNLDPCIIVIELSVTLLKDIVEQAVLCRRAFLQYIFHLFRFLLFNHLLDHLDLLFSIFKVSNLRNAGKFIYLETDQFIANLRALALVQSELSHKEKERQLDEKELDATLQTVYQWTEDLKSDKIARDTVEFSLEMFKIMVHEVKSLGLTEKISLSVSHFQILLSIMENIQGLLAIDSLHLNGDNQLVENDGGKPSKDEYARFHKSRLESYRAWFILIYWAVASHTDFINFINDCIEDQVSQYISAIDAATFFCQTVALGERYFFGCVAVKLGHQMYNRDRDAQAVLFYHTACMQLLQWCQADADNMASRMQEVSLLKIHDCLAECQRRCGLLENTMATITKALTLSGSFGNNNGNITYSLVKSWVKVTKLGWKTGNMDVVCRTLGGSLKDLNMCREQVLTILQEELSGLQALSPRIWKAELSVLEEMVKSSEEVNVKASSLVSLAQTLWQGNCESQYGCPKECLTHAATLIRGQGYSVLQGQIYLWQYILGHEEICRSLVKASKQEKIAEEEDGQDIIDGISPVNKMVCSDIFLDVPRTMRDEQEELELLGNAVKCWQQCMQEEKVEMLAGTCDQKRFLESLLMCADILRCHRQFILELQVLYLAYKLVSLNGTALGERLVVSSALMNVFIALGVHKFQSCKLENVTDHMELKARDQVKYKICLANFFLKSGKPEQAMDHISVVMNTITWEKNVQDQVLKGALSRLLGEYLALPACAREKTEVALGDYVLSHLMEAVRSHTSAVINCLGDKAVDRMVEGSVALREVSIWSILSEHLESVLLLGRMYRHIGDQRRARCYFKEGLKVCESQGWIKWASLFTVELSHLQWLAENSTDAVHLLVKSVILLNNHHTSDLSSDDFHTNTFRKIGPSLTRKLSSVEECFGFESVRDIHFGRECDSLITDNAVPSEASTMLEVCNLLHLLESKIYVRRKQLCDHTVSCECVFCLDTEYQNLLIAQGLLSARLHLDLPDGCDKAISILFSLKALCSKVQVLRSLQDLMCTLAKAGLAVRNSQSTHKDETDILLVEVSCVLAQVFLQKGQLGEAVSEVKKGFDLLDKIKGYISQACLLKSRLHTIAACTLSWKIQSSGRTKITEPVPDLRKPDLVDKITKKLVELRLGSAPVMDDGRQISTPQQVTAEIEENTSLASEPSKSAHLVLQESDLLVVNNSSKEEIFDIETVTNYPDSLDMKETQKKKTSKAKESLVRKRNMSARRILAKTDDDRSENNVPECCRTVPYFIKSKFDFSPRLNLDMNTQVKSKVHQRKNQKEIPVTVDADSIESVSTFSARKSNKDRSSSLREKVDNSPLKCKTTKKTPLKKSRIHTKNVPKEKLAITENIEPTSTLSLRKRCIAIPQIAELDNSAVKSKTDNSPLKGRTLRSSKSKKQELVAKSLFSSTDHELSLETVRACSDDEVEGTGEAWYQKTLKDLCHSSWNHESSFEIQASNLKKVAFSGTDSKDYTHQVLSHLDLALALMQHFPPAGVYSQACKLLAWEYIDRCPWTTVGLLNEAAAVTLRHQFLITLHKQIRNNFKETSTTPEDTKESLLLEKKQETEMLMSARSSILFPWSSGRVQEIVRMIPEGWTVCQFSVVQSPGCPHRLLLSRLTRNLPPITVSLNNFSSFLGQTIMSDFKDIMQNNVAASKIRDKMEWWSKRIALDLQLEGLLEMIERRWLGEWRCLLRPQSLDMVYQQQLTESSETLSTTLTEMLGTVVSIETAKIILELSQSPGDSPHLPAVISHILHLEADCPFLEALTSAVLDARPKLVCTPDQPVILILDKHLHSLPWENLPVLAGHQVTRVASLTSLYLLLLFHKGNESVVQKGINPASAFYLVDPENNLKNTQTAFRDMFAEQMGWKGIVGEKPSKEQFCEALTQYDLFVYCGHGNGSKYLSGDELQQQKCRAVSLLMGCSSLRLDIKQHLDADGFIFSYLLARCPCVVGNLWDVTDRDIDRFLKQLLDLWLQSTGNASLLTFVPAARMACRMRYLIGAAPVVYGLPVWLAK